MTLTFPIFSLSNLFGASRPKTETARVPILAQSSRDDVARAERAALCDIMDQHPEAFGSEYGLVEMSIRYRSAR